MAIIITDQYRLRQKNFLDDRQGIAASTTALARWDDSTNPLPDGFEVCVSGVWYVYNSQNLQDPYLGKFRLRTATQDGRIDQIENELSNLENKTIPDLDAKVEKYNTQLLKDDFVHEASTFEEILTERYWTDSTGLSHARAGMTVTVVSDSAENNGVWYLSNSSYSNPLSWIKLLSRKEVIKTTDTATLPTDNNIYSAKKIDENFPKKTTAETISGVWTFADNVIAGKDLTVTGKTTLGEVTARKLTAEELNTSGNFEVGGTLTVNKQITGRSNLEVLGNEFVRGELYVGRTLDVTGQTSLENTSFGNAGDGVVVGPGGKTTATFHKLKVHEADIDGLGDIIEEKMGLIGVGNLLINTGFTGEAESESMKTDKNLYADTETYSAKNYGWSVTTRDWQVVEDEGSVTGYSLYLPDELTQVSQVTAKKLFHNVSYILSWKQKGDLRVTVDGVEYEQKVVPVNDEYSKQGYSLHWVKFTVEDLVPPEVNPETIQEAIDNGEYSEPLDVDKDRDVDAEDIVAYHKSVGNRRVEIRFFGGPGYVCEIKLEEGVVPTSWFPSYLDTDPLAKRVDGYEYLHTAFVENTEKDLVSSVVLKNAIQVGEVIDEKVEAIYGGFSGVTTDQDSDVMLWSGGSFERAQELLFSVIRDPNYLDGLTHEELKQLVGSAITLGSKSIFTDIYAVGKFKGKHLDENGVQITPNHGLTASIPLYNKTNFEWKAMYFKNGILDVEKEGSIIKELMYTIDDRTRAELYIKFEHGKVVRYSVIVPGEEVDIYYEGVGVGVVSVPVPMNLNPNSTNTEEIYLTFNNGYLVDVSYEKAIRTSTYYWF